MKFEEKLRKLNSTISSYEVDVYDEDFTHSMTKAIYFRLNEFDDLRNELNASRWECESFESKSLFPSKYRKLYLSARKKYRSLLQNLKNNTATIKCNEALIYENKYVQKLMSRFWIYDDSISVEENIKKLIIIKIEQRIREINNELYKLKKHPYDYINTQDNFVGPNRPLRFDSDSFYYKDTVIAVKESHHFAVFYNERTEDSTKLAALNILAFYSGEPFFYFTENYEFNRKICDLYEQFNLLDMVQLRKSDFFNNKKYETSYTERPIMKYKSGHNFIEVDDLEHEVLLELYHASLKQFESLPRCVFFI